MHYRHSAFLRLATQLPCPFCEKRLDLVMQVDADLVAVDELLKSYHGTLDAHVDTWLILKTADPKYVYEWRLEAEEKMRAKGKPGMSKEQVADFVDRYMPAYKAYLPGLYSDGPTTAKEGRLLVVEVDKTRGIVES
jgi:D-glycerate 3-kinase